jgi:uncharacterized protein YkwD
MRKIFGLVLVSVVLVLAVGCEEETSCEGQYDCACRADGTCDPGLACSGGVCIYYSPPPASTAGEGGEQQPVLDGGSTLPTTDAQALPDICQSVFQQWDAECESWEDELIQAINARRAADAVCGAHGAMPPAPALVKNVNLQCAARLNSKEIVDIGDIAAHSAQKATATARAQAAGYGEGKVAENILTNRTPVSRVVDTWMDYEDSCFNIMNSEFTEIGAGCFQIPDADVATVNIFLAWTVQIGGPIVGGSP